MCDPINVSRSNVEIEGLILIDISDDYGTLKGRPASRFDRWRDPNLFRKIEAPKTVKSRSKMTINTESP